MLFGELELYHSVLFQFHLHIYGCQSRTNLRVPELQLTKVIEVNKRINLENRIPQLPNNVTFAAEDGHSFINLSPPSWDSRIHKRASSALEIFRPGHVVHPPRNTSYLLLGGSIPIKQRLIETKNLPFFCSSLWAQANKTYSDAYFSQSLFPAIRAASETANSTEVSDTIALLPCSSCRLSCSAQLLPTRAKPLCRRQIMKKVNALSMINSDLDFDFRPFVATPVNLVE